MKTNKTNAAPATTTRTARAPRTARPAKAAPPALALAGTDLLADIPETGPEGPALPAAPSPVVRAPRAKKERGPSKAYPFQSKSAILALVQEDDGFALECLQILCARQTEHEQATKTTLSRNHRGFMSSHAVRGTTLAQKARDGELSPEDMASARTMVLHYGKQLANHFRAEAIANNPELADLAKIFSAG